MEFKLLFFWSKLWPEILSLYMELKVFLNHSFPEGVKNCNSDSPLNKAEIYGLTSLFPKKLEKSAIQNTDTVIDKISFQDQHG